MPGIVCDICGQNEMEPVDGEPNMYRCAYCGTKYTKEQLQERLVKIDGPIKVEGVQDFDKLLENGNTFLKLGELDKAYDAFTRLTNEYPNKYESWYGYVKTCVERGETTDGKIKTAKQVANELEKMQILQDLKMTAQKLESEEDYKKAIRYHEVIKEGYPELYLSWYEYVKCNLQLDHVSLEEFENAVAIANEQEKNLMISELLNYAKDLENKSVYTRAARVFDLIIDSFPEKAVGYYGYTREMTSVFRNLPDDNKLEERLNMAVELSKQEENQTYINDLETFKEIKQNILDIRLARANVQSYVNDKNQRLDRASQDYIKEENTRKAQTDGIKSRLTGEINQLKNEIQANNNLITEIDKSRYKGFIEAVLKGPIGLFFWLFFIIAIIVGYWRLTFASGSIGMGFLGLILCEIPLAIIGVFWGLASNCWDRISSVSSDKKRIKKLKKANEKSQKKIEKITANMNQQVSSKNEVDSAELRDFALQRDKTQETINKETADKIAEKEKFINETTAKNEELVKKISA